MRRHISKRSIHCWSVVATSLIVIGMFATLPDVCRAAERDEAPRALSLRPEIRSGGVLEESHVYHRQQPVPTAGAKSVVPAGGWYGYGFPVSTFRWGWFGAAHYYPTVFWHKGYYGDCCRYGYRRGY
jgi:hypothetical protein